MNIIFFGRDYWLLTADEYALCIKFFDFLETKTIAAGAAFREFIPFIKRNGLFYGFASKNGNELPVPSFFFQYKEKWFAVHPTIKFCSKCEHEFDAVIARSGDLYWRADSQQNAFEWSLTLPYVNQCPNCGFDESGTGQKFLAVFYNNKIITAL